VYLKQLTSRYVPVLLYLSPKNAAVWTFKYTIDLEVDFARQAFLLLCLGQPTLNYIVKIGTVSWTVRITKGGRMP